MLIALRILREQRDVGIYFSLSDLTLEWKYLYPPIEELVDLT